MAVVTTEYAVVVDGKYKIKSVKLSTGNSTGTGSEQTIAHGLGAIPTKFGIVPTASGCSVTTPYFDQTNMYVTATNGKTYNWWAELQ